MAETRKQVEELKGSLDDLVDVERDRADVERDKSRYLKIAVATFVVATVIFVAILVWNRVSLSQINDRFDAVETDLRNLACYASDLARQAPPEGVVCDDPVIRGQR